MKRTALKITIVTLLGAAVMAAPATTRAEPAGTNTPAPAKPAKPAALKFYGPVTAVNTNAMTFTVGEQTFAVTTKSELTKNDKPATLADAVVGEPARGNYIKKDNGKLEITKVRFGKKPAGKKRKEAPTTNAPTAN